MSLEHLTKKIMKSLKVTSMLAVLMFLFITGMQAQTVTPSKKYITKELNNVSNFSSIKVLGSTDVEYRQSSGSKTEISIYGSDNLVDLLEVSTANGVLQVNIKKGVKILSGERRLKVIASSPSLDEVDIKGSADVYLKGTIKGVDLTLNITGSGDIEAENLQYTNLSAYKREWRYRCEKCEGHYCKNDSQRFGRCEYQRRCEMGCVDCKRLR